MQTNQLSKYIEVLTITSVTTTYSGIREIPYNVVNSFTLSFSVTADAETTVILLLFNAGPLDITWAKLHPRVSAILACYLPAQSTGKALYNTLMATSPDAVPAGRLTMTWPADLSQVSCTLYIVISVAMIFVQVQ